MLSLLISIATSLPPSAPPERPWPGGVWKPDGRTYPADSFQYVPIAEWSVWQKKMASWLKYQPNRTKAIIAKESTLRYEMFDLPATLAKLSQTLTLESDRPAFTGTASLATCGGTGAVAVEYLYPAGRTIKVTLNDLDFTAMGDSIDLPRPPIRIVGKVGLLEGTITGDKGKFVGTEIKVTDGIVKRMELTADWSTGRWAATAETTFGTQTYRGKMRAAK